MGGGDSQAVNTMVALINFSLPSGYTLMPAVRPIPWIVHDRLILDPDSYEFTDCLFEDLETNDVGAALYFKGGDDATSARIVKCTFHGCSSIGTQARMAVAFSPRQNTSKLCLRVR
jgi:hypothetical protein